MFWDIYIESEEVGDSVRQVKENAFKVGFVGGKCRCEFNAELQKGHPSI
jgi:hypothetical protein